MGVPFSSCNEFLDINDDPNNPLEAANSLLLPSAQVDIVGAFGMSTGGLSQITSSYVHQIVQRGTDVNDYGIAGGDFGVITPWNVMYTRALKDIQIIIDQGTETGEMHYVAIAQILKAYSMSIMVDVYGDVPYFEAFLGSENLQPTYDDGEVVYDEVLGLLDTAIDNLTGPSTKSVASAGGDLFYGGDLEKWERLANTIKLKMYNQMRLIRNVSGEVNALISADKMLDDASDDFELVHGTNPQPDDRNPGWVQEFASANPQYYVSPFFFETMQNINTFNHRDYGNDISPTVVDPRVPYYFFNQLPIGSSNSDAENPCSYCPSRSGLPFLSIWQFSFNIDPNEGFDQATSQSAIGLYPIGGAFDDGKGSDGGLGPTLGAPQAPQRLLTYFARKYIEAELYLTGVATGNARDALEEAIRASFEEVNEATALVSNAEEIASADIDTYVNAVLVAYDGVDDAAKLEHIMTQKWIASFGFGIDSYTDYRRTGYPILHDGNTDNLAFTVRTREYPHSFPWVTQNLQTNASAPAQKLVTTQGAKPFWLP